jgi:hypothetical protein
MLAVPGYPLMLGVLAGGWTQLGLRSRSGRWVVSGWMLAVTIIMMVSWIQYRSIMSDQGTPGDRMNRTVQLGRTMLWLIGGMMTIGIGLALWGWVIYLRVGRKENPK